MPNQPEYICTRCGKQEERDLLTVKKAMFLEMGVGGRTLRSRVTDWLCPLCVKNDPDYNRESFRGQNAKRPPREAVPQNITEPYILHKNG